MKVIGSPRERMNYTTPLEEMDEHNDTLSKELRKLRDIKT
jgi:hypothetical protein